MNFLVQSRKLMSNQSFVTVTAASNQEVIVSEKCSKRVLLRTLKIIVDHNAQRKNVNLSKSLGNLVER